LDFVGGISQFLLASVLAFSAVQKAVPGRSLRPVLKDLRFPAHLARPTAYLVVALEPTPAVTLILAPTWPIVPVLVLGLGMSFCLAGAIALIGHHDVACACFGGAALLKLGWNQVIAFPIWGAGSYFAYSRPVSVDTVTGLSLISGFLLIIAVSRVFRMRRLSKQLRWDRLATAA